MTQELNEVEVEYSFLPGHHGPLFSILFGAGGGDRKLSRGLLFLPPFAEEMNKSRRMVAMQARRFAQRGVAVLVVDLYGCGDSSGEFQDATWDIWIEDLVYCLHWLESRVAGPVGLWGLRGGALLAMEVGSQIRSIPKPIILWQPVTSGAAMLTEFLRVEVAADVVREEKDKRTTRTLKEQLQANKAIEVAGYLLTPGLANAISSQTLEHYGAGAEEVYWFELARGPRQSVSPASRRIMDKWKKAGLHVHARVVRGEPFWRTLEITECPELIHATTPVIDCRPQ